MKKILTMVSLPEEDQDFDSNDYFNENDAVEFSVHDTKSEGNPQVSEEVYIEPQFRSDHEQETKYFNRKKNWFT